MNREIPVANRVVYKKDVERTNDLHLSKISSMKFSNLSALKSKQEAKSLYKVKPIDLTKLIPIESRNRRVRTVMHDERIRQENKNMYNRLVNQKPTLSSKLFAEERHKNVEFLRRIGRYPYRPNSTVMLEALQQEGANGLERSHTFDGIEEASEGSSNIKISLNSLQSVKYYHINSKIQQQEKKEYMILLWSKVVQLNKHWYSMKFQRFKNHYQIDASPYPQHNVEHTVKLAEQVGTAMLSQNDYDYEFITSKYIKFTHQALCLSFDLKADKRKHFYKFVKKTNSQPSSAPTHHPPALSPHSPHPRKTVFALENQQRENKQQKEPIRARPRILTQQIEESHLQSAYDELGREDILIDLGRK